jgi:chromosome partitioning protein
MCKVISCASQKGGVTKTTTVLNLATALALEGKKVLTVDMDPQGSLSICAGVDEPETLTQTTYSLLNAVMDDEQLPEPSEYIIPCGKIDIIPCNISLSAYELNRGHEIGTTGALQAVLEPLKQLYDIILIDCGPSLGVLTVNAIAASDSVLITVTPQLLSAVGLKLLINTIQKVQRHINPTVAIEGVLMAMCDTRTNLYKDVNNIITKVYRQKIRVFDTTIPNSTKVGEANFRRQSVLLYDANSKPAQAYRAFAKELMANAE